MRAWCTYSMRSIAVALLLMVCIAPAASAKFGVVLSLSKERPAVSEQIRVLIRAEQKQPDNCLMRLLAVAPGIAKHRALDAFIIGGYSVNGPQGNTFHALRPTPRMGFLRTLTRVGPTTWQATIRFPRVGSWRLVVPNWCAPGYAATPPIDRAIAVR